MVKVLPSFVGQTRALENTRLWSLEARVLFWATKSELLLQTGCGIPLGDTWRMSIPEEEKEEEKGKKEILF